MSRQTEALTEQFDCAAHNRMNYEIFMRLTPDSRAPAKADPCVGCNPCPCSGVVGGVVVVVVVVVVVAVAVVVVVVVVVVVAVVVVVVVAVDATLQATRGIGQQSCGRRGPGLRASR